MTSFAIVLRVRVSQHGWASFIDWNPKVNFIGSRSAMMPGSHGIDKQGFARRRTRVLFGT